MWCILFFFKEEPGFGKRPRHPGEPPLQVGPGSPPRQLERLFRKYLQRTPPRYYLELRLSRARSLLGQTAMSVLGVALACGFVSASHFSKCYREFFHKTPREERLAPH